MDCTNWNRAGKIIGNFLGLCKEAPEKEDKPPFMPPSTRGAHDAMALIDDPDGWEANRDLQKIKKGTR